MRGLPIDLAGDRLFVKPDHDQVREFGERRRLNRHQSGTHARRLQGDAVFGNAGAMGADLLKQREQRAVRGDEVVQRPPAQVGGAGVEELLRRHVDIADAVLGTDHQHRTGQRVQDRAGVDFEPVLALPHGEPAGHAAIFSMTGAFSMTGVFSMTGA